MSSSSPAFLLAIPWSNPRRALHGDKSPNSWGGDDLALPYFLALFSDVTPDGLRERRTNCSQVQLGTKNRLKRDDDDDDYGDQTTLFLPTRASTPAPGKEIEMKKLGCQMSLTLRLVLARQH